MSIGAIQSEDDLRQFILREVESSDLDALVRQLQGAAPQARVNRSTAQAIVTATLTAVSFDTVEFDKGAAAHWAAGSPTRLTCQRAGCYVATGGMAWTAAAGGNQRLTYVRINGTTYRGGQGSPFNAATGSATSVAEVVALVAGDYLELVVYQDTGGNLNAAGDGQMIPHLALAWVSP